ncbi:monocarboxylate transporter 3 [Diabrotica virgifera virgifera]|uniref:Major facilitator superfamily (MFS) profile domain-containing protein n=1 Tax=Diabrotica virgifera virgifera TaxID=50390 RepID=A0ABM5JI64_DIAVI|nr:monocarboxylate transporter 3 [Diabrotica virgifera virgifera]XP_050497627.1 monocarboxylate transporter 3 [Diabrotica virgifera virgifera]XP_050497628.1 monocarboxylate transporter 3 [Diabrotica virgifera virgifera]
MPVATTEASDKSKSGYQKICPEEQKDTKKCKFNGVDKNETVIDDNEKDPLNNEVSSQPDIVIPPDGGWGWLVVLGSFMCNLIVDGTIFSFGTFLKIISKEFDADPADVTLVGSLMSGFYLIAGPFVSAIANRYGFRIVVIFGGLLSAAAFALCYFATSVTYLCVLYGVIGGIGFGFIYAPSIIILGFYFERWRGLATGIAVCGSGIGTFVYAPMTDIVITKFGWRGAMLVHAALILICALSGILYRPLKAMKIDSATEPLNQPEPEFKVPVVAQQKLELAMRMMKRGSDAGSVVDHQSSIPRLLGVNNNSVYPRVSDVYHTICVPNGTVTSKQTPHLAWTRERSKTEGKLQVSHLHKLKRMRSVDKPSEVTRPLYREDIFFNQSLKHLPQYTSQTSVEYNLSVTRAPTKNDIEEEKTHKCMLCPEAFRRVLATMLDLSLFQSPTFIVLAVGGFFTMMGFFVPYMFLVDRAKNAGIENAVWLVSSIGIANTVGRMFYGLLTSLPKANALVITNIALTVGGLATIFSGLSLTREYQFTYCVVFGLAISSFAAIRSVVVVDLLGLEKLTNAFGLLLMFQGIAAIMGAPLAGTFMKATGSIDACFYFSGGLILFSAILCYPLNWINTWEKRRHLETKSSLV